MNQHYDLVIIGAGSGGLSAAALARQLEARVALVEKRRIGGDCTWRGCVPSNTLLKTARVAHEMRTADHHGLVAARPEAVLKAVMDHVRDVIDEIAREESPEALRSQGIAVWQHEGRFLDPHTLAVGDATLTARRFLLTTGAHPFIPPIRGLQDVDYLTYETLWDLEALPERLLIVGGGPIGCEMAQAFRRLGAEVTVFANGDQVLPRDDPAASEVLGTVFEREGIRVLLEARVASVRRDPAGLHVEGGGQSAVGDALLLAVGRRPTVLLAVGRRPTVAGLDLERAGVAYSADGIQVNQNLQTSQRHIYAAGDCTGGPQFTHYAGWQASLAVRNALLPGASRAVRDQVPWTTFTDPEVAHVGLTERDARERFGEGLMTFEWPMALVDRARTDGDTSGFIKLVYQRDGTLLGATVVARRAGEMIEEWTLAMRKKIRVGELSYVIHVYPTYSVAGQQAAAAIRVDRLMSGASGWVVRRLMSLTRRIADRRRR